MGRIAGGTRGRGRRWRVSTRYELGDKMPMGHKLPQFLTRGIIPVLFPKETDALVLKSKFKTKEERVLGECLPWQQHNLVSCQGCQLGLVSKIRLLY